MTVVSFRDLRFEREGEFIKSTLLKIFVFRIPVSDLLLISRFCIRKGALVFQSDSDRVKARFGFLLSKHMGNLVNSINGRRAVYVHQESGIPLLGNGSFGIVDRGTSLIEVKPVTGCNLNCIYCSIDEGMSRKQLDYVIEKEYLVNVFRELVEYKGCDGIEAHIGPNGEPLLYGAIVELVADIAAIDRVKTISIDTNGAMLTKGLANELIDAGLTRFNLSLNSLDPVIARKMAGCRYDVEEVIRVARSIADHCVITPVWLPGFNDAEIPKLIGFAKEIGAGTGIQKYLNYRFGRNPAKEISWDQFYRQLREWEEQYGVKLLLDPGSFNIVKAKSLPKPFKKGDVVFAETAVEGRRAGEMLAVSSGRTITVPNCRRHGRIKIRITRSKHNIFFGKLI
ncbi:MAG: radical SAM protein [archaeon]